MNILSKYAALLVNYSLELKKEDRLYISTTTLAEPLVREVYREAIKIGAYVDVDLSFREKSRIFLTHANETQLKRPPTLHKLALETFDAYLNIRAPFNLSDQKSVSKEKQKLRNISLKPIMDTYFSRTATGELKRSLCQYPTSAAAQMAGMSLEEYQHFVFNACHLFDSNPVEAWLKVRREQQRIVDYLNNVKHIQYKSGHTDISFSVEGRTWINSDGRSNMPSGEVFTGPVEDSVNGTVFFSFPSVYMGNIVKNITLEVENGVVQKWSAESGQEVLDTVFQIPGARQFGEVAIGTNYNIQQATGNILFDEKIGGTIHMAVGQSYKQSGGLNNSSIHWDMITDMSKDGEIWADNKKIYEKGSFLI